MTFPASVPTKCVQARDLCLTLSAFTATFGLTAAMCHYPSFDELSADTRAAVFNYGGAQFEHQTDGADTGSVLLTIYISESLMAEGALVQAQEDLARQLRDTDQTTLFVLRVEIGDAGKPSPRQEAATDHDAARIARLVVQLRITWEG